MKKFPNFTVTFLILPTLFSETDRNFAKFAEAFFEFFWNFILQCTKHLKTNSILYKGSMPKVRTVLESRTKRRVCRCCMLATKKNTIRKLFIRNCCRIISLVQNSNLTLKCPNLGHGVRT